MVSIIQFNLDDPDDRMAHLRATKSLELCLALWEVSQLKKKYEYREDMDWDTVEKFFEDFFEILENQDIKLGKLVL